MCMCEMMGGGKKGKTGKKSSPPVLTILISRQPPVSYQSGGKFQWTKGLAGLDSLVKPRNYSIDDPLLMEDDLYRRAVDKNMSFHNTMSNLENAAIQSGVPPLMIAGAAVKGVRSIGKALGIGENKVKKAKKEAMIAKTGRNLAEASHGYQAPLYGKKGIKLKTYLNNVY